MNSFFDGDILVTCSAYQRLLEGSEDHHVAGRKFVDQIWAECRRFVDADTKQRARQDLFSVFWELYLGHTLRDAGLSLFQYRTTKNQRGPDFLATNPNVWLEAVAPEPGTGRDALVEPPLGRAYDVPIDEFVLRLRSAIESKAKIFADYQRDGLIPPGQATVIAIGGLRLPTRFSEQPIPRIVRATLGVGDLAVHIDRFSGTAVGHSIEERTEVLKQSAVSVRTDVFLNPAYSHISAILYGTSDWVNRPCVPGSDFVVVHNPLCAAPLPAGWISRGREFFWGDEKLRVVRHKSEG